MVSIATALLTVGNNQFFEKPAQKAGYSKRCLQQVRHWDRLNFELSSILSSFLYFLSLGNGLISTEMLSRRAVKLV